MIARPAHSPAVSPERAPPRLTVVSYPANVPGTPRGDRTRALTQYLSADWEIDLISGPGTTGTAGAVSSRTLLRKYANVAHASMLLDKFEPWSARRFHAWQPTAAGALLIGFPF